jgi:hypothetical protein
MFLYRIFYVSYFLSEIDNMITILYSISKSSLRIRDNIPKTLFSSYHKNEPNKIVLYYIRLERFATYKYFSSLNQLVSYKENEALWTQPQGWYTQHFIFFITYECAHLATVFVPSNPFQPSVM